MRISNGLAMLAAVGLIAACSREGGEAAVADNSVANATEEAPDPKQEARERERGEVEPPAERPLLEFASFETSEQQRERRLSRTYNQCMEAATSTADYRDCSSAEFERVEGQMDRALERAGGGLPEAGRERLQADQRRWREGLPDFCQRELEEEGAEGGSMDLLTLDSCSLREVVRRTLWLESLSS